MITPIYASQEHKAILDSYINMCLEFTKDVSNKNRFENYLELIDIITEYHPDRDWETHINITV